MNQPQGAKGAVGIKVSGGPQKTEKANPEIQGFVDKVIFLYLFSFCIDKNCFKNIL